MKMPWHNSYMDIFSHEKYGEDLRRRHDQGIRRGLKSGKLKFLVPLVLAALVASAHAATKTCPSGTTGPLTATGPAADVFLARAAPALVVQSTTSAGTATVVVEISCDGSNWAQVANSSMGLTGAGVSQAVSVLQPACSYRANVTACSSCSVTVAYACSGA